MRGNHTFKHIFASLFTLSILLSTSAHAGLSVKCGYSYPHKQPLPNGGEAFDLIMGTTPLAHAFTAYNNDQNQDPYYFPGFPSFFVNQDLACEAVCKAYSMIRRKLFTKKANIPNWTLALNFKKVIQCKTDDQGNEPKMDVISDQVEPEFDWDIITELWEEYEPLDPGPVITGYAPGTPAFDLNFAFLSNIRTAVELGLITYDVKKTLSLTLLGAGLTYAAYDAGILSSAYWMTKISSTGLSYLGLSAAVFSGIAAGVISLSPTTKYAHIAKDPCLYEHLSPEAQINLVKFYPGARKKIEAANADLKTLISQHLQND